MSSDNVIESKAPSDDSVFISLRDVRVSYDMERGEARVVDDTDLDIYQDEIVGVVGESGSGKSMIASSIIDAAPPPGRTTGSITYYPKDGGDPIDVLSLDDEDLRTFRWEKVSMVFQGAMSSFNPTMTIGEHFEETIEAHDRSRVERMEYGRQLMEDLYLDPDYVFDSYPHELSGGMKQRALIALSLILDPEVLIMDEPTSSLDLMMQRSIMNMIGDLQEEYDLTVIFITHDLPLVTGLVDRLVIMYAFNLAEIGPINEVLENPRHPYTRALLRSVPNMDTPVEDMTPIEGTSPDPVNVPSGCPYHPRCPMADETCELEEPPHHKVSEEHTSACFYWEEVEEEIPYSLEQTPDDTSSESPDAIMPSETILPDGEEPVVALEDVEVHFERDAGLINNFFGGGDDTTVKAVDGVTLEIGEQDIVSIVGESGCGKTTLGKTAIGLQRPTGGSVKYRGQDIWDAKDGIGKADIGYQEIRQSLQIIHQDPGSSLNPNRTVVTNLSAPIKKYRPDISPERRENIIHRLLQRLNMEPASDYANRFPHQLSGGEQQRVALGRALLLQPDLILADEAVSALDVSLRIAMMDLMLDLQEQFGTSLLFISHDFAVARYLAEKADGRIAVMYLGNLVEIGSAKEVIENPKHPYTKALVWSTPPLDPERAAETAGETPPVRKIDVPTPEDVPSGCSFHTRCPNIIPPADIDIEQEAYNDIVDLRFAIEEGELEEEIWRSIGVNPDKNEGITTSPMSYRDEFVAEVWDQYFETELNDPHRERVESALESVVQGEGETAAQELESHYASRCEREDPELRSSHPVACHLYED